MQNKLREITEKIYQEGVSKGNEEAEKIISGAREKAAKIIGDAEKEAKGIIAEAQKKADEMIKNAGSELKLSFRQALGSLLQEIENKITCSVVDDPVSEIFSDNKFLVRLIEIITDNWSKGNEAGLEIHLPDGITGDVEKYLAGKTAKILSDGIILRPVKSLEKGFEIHPSGKGYKISVTDRDLASYIKEFIRPKLAQLLFEENK